MQTSSPALVLCHPTRALRLNAGSKRRLTRQSHYLGIMASCRKNAFISAAKRHRSRAWGLGPRLMARRTSNQPRSGAGPVAVNLMNTAGRIRHHACREVDAAPPETSFAGNAAIDRLLRRFAAAE